MSTRGTTRELDEHRRDADLQDVRLAVVLNGGVSLAVWISGVVQELSRLVQGSRAPAGGRVGDVYAELLDLLHARARIDVVAGTSAGGVNGGFLALSLVRGADLSSLRELWRDQGDLAQLLRDPRERAAPSLLRGQFFHDRLADAYRTVLDSCTGRPAALDEHVELYLTGTLWKGRRSRFTDDMGRPIDEVDHDATFHFSSDPGVVGRACVGNLCHDDVGRQLAVASRCTSSFPGAFEPFEVVVADESAGSRWTSTAGLVDFHESQHVLDGGILRNKPVRPAIDAVYRQSASWQVRRVLAYVVPDPGEKAERDDPPPPLGAHEVLLGVLTRLRSTDSVSAELAEIERRNADTRFRRRTRDRLAGAFLDVGGGRELAAAAFPAYLDVRKETSARAVTALLLAAPAARRWSADELTVVLRDIADSPDGLPFVPTGDLPSALGATPDQWRWGQSTVARLGDLVVDVLKRAVWLAPLGSEQRVEIVRRRDDAHAILSEIRLDRLRLDEFWRAAGTALPSRGEGAATEQELDELHRWMASTLGGWESTSGGRRRAALHAQALRLAECLLAGRDALAAVAQDTSAQVDPRGEEQARLRALIRVLLQEATSPEDVLTRMLVLEVAHVAFAGASGDVEQEVELVQISSDAPELLTGIQEHHFGAFYRASWRVNDWLRGRLDGSRQLVETLLEPERLRQLLDHRLPSTESTEQLYRALRAVAVGPSGGRHHDDLVTAWDAQAEVLRAELSVLEADGPLPRAFPRIARRIAARVQADLLEGELVALAESVRDEADPLEPSERWAASVLTAAAAGPLSFAAAESLARGSHVIGAQRIRHEMRDGTDTFARTATHGAASLTSMLCGLTRPRVLATTLMALRGYAVLVWVLVNRLTTRSHNGRNLISLLVGVGAALVALTLVMPGVPLGVTLAGAALLLTATTATAVAQRRQLGLSLARRTAVAAVAVLLGLVGAVGYDLWRDGADVTETVLKGAARVGVVAAVVGLGWFIARAEPHRWHDARAVPSSGQPTSPGATSARVPDPRAPSSGPSAGRPGRGQRRSRTRR